MLHSRPEQRPPVYLSAFHEGAARLAGRLAAGVWTLGDPQSAPKVIGAYGTACEDAGREIGTVIVQSVFSYAPDDDQALEAAREWKGTMVDRHYTDDIADPAQIYRNGADEVPPVKRIKAIEKLGADVLCLMNVSGADPHGAIDFYRDKVLPELR